MSKLVKMYLYELVGKYNEIEQKAFELRTPADVEEIERLAHLYPQLPGDFVGLLEAVGKNNNSKVPIFYFAEDLFLLLDANTICAYAKMEGFAVQPAGLEVTEEQLLSMRKDEELEDFIDDEINPVALRKDWLLFAEGDQGGKLYIDFNPGAYGKMGQIVGYFKDQDFYYVLADSFAELLENQVLSHIPYYQPTGLLTRSG
jgi:cell wall assembly regulator SMI1